MVPRGLCRWVCQGLPRDPCLVLGLAGGVFISLLLSPSFLLGNQLGAHPSAKRFNNLCKRQRLLGAHSTRALGQVSGQRALGWGPA